MNRSDAYYRAFLSHKKLTAEQKDCRRDLRTFAEAEGLRRIAVTRMSCTVDENWINAIETGLAHIEKAIKEERQFIYSNGEVIPIEKVKQVSKDSVVHLARHAELITRVPEGEDIIPDQLYTVERLSDYAVYENRFLYMLLCYLRDFVSLRYQKIVELTNRYEGHLTMDKEIDSFGRTVTVRLELEEHRRDDPYLRTHNPAKALIDRMDLILKTILAFLATPLMESAGKAALLKPPITKTNVLKMDNNFKGAMALYEYIIAYEGEGYTVTEEQREPSASGDLLREDMAEIELILSELTYRHGLGLLPLLKTDMEREEKDARQTELKNRADNIDQLRRRLEREGEPLEAYILELETLTRNLRRRLEDMDPLYAELDRRKRTELTLTDTVASLNARVDGLGEDIRQREQAYRRSEEESELRHRQEQAALLEARSVERAEWSERVEALEDAHREELAQLKAELSSKQAELAQANAEKQELTAQMRLLHAQILGQRAMEKGVTPEEMEAMTEKDSFDELERELEAFIKLYDRVWRQTKRRIRKDLLNPKSIKGQVGRQ